MDINSRMQIYRKFDFGKVFGFLMQTARLCEEYFCIALPGIRLSKRVQKFEKKFYNKLYCDMTDSLLFLYATVGLLYTVSQKTVQTHFLSELCQISTDCKNFWHKDSRENRLFRGVLIFHLT